MRGLAKDAIPAIDLPVFVKGTDAPFMRGDEYVIGIADGTTVKAYSIWHLNGHEIVNDRLGEAPIAVTWCPLCFTGVVYSRRVEGRTLSFGVSGMLWRENLVMYDRETESWWAQASGETRLVDAATKSIWDPVEGRAVSGPLRGTSLPESPSNLSYWFAWRAFFPNTTWSSVSRASRSPTHRDPLTVCTLCTILAA